MNAIRDSLLATIDGLLQRPGMVASTAREAEVLYWHLSRTLDVIEGHDHAGERAELARYGKVGLTGPFRALFGESGDYRAEVVSVIAQLAAIRGARVPTTTVPVATWDAWINGLQSRFDERDARRSQVREHFGQPSFGVKTRAGELLAAVDAYMREDDATAWIFFDYRQEASPRIYEGDGTFATTETEYDPWLRSVRYPADRWQDGLILTTYGKHHRWGTGWWLHHATRLNDDRAAIANQLREIDADDPSQALKQH